MLCISTVGHKSNAEHSYYLDQAVHVVVVMTASTWAPMAIYFFNV